jgi:hypothetical protein
VAATEGAAAGTARVARGVHVLYALSTAGRLAPTPPLATQPPISRGESRGPESSPTGLCAPCRPREIFRWLGRVVGRSVCGPSVVFFSSRAFCAFCVWSVVVGGQR